MLAWRVQAACRSEHGLTSPSTERYFPSAESANFEEIYVLDVLDVTNPQKSMTKWLRISTRALETFCNPVFQHFRVLSEEPPRTRSSL